MRLQQKLKDKLVKRYHHIVCLFVYHIYSKEEKHKKHRRILQESIDLDETTKREIEKSEKIQEIEKLRIENENMKDKLKRLENISNQTKLRFSKYNLFGLTVTIFSEQELQERVDFLSGAIPIKNMVSKFSANGSDAVVFAEKSKKII